MTTENNATQIDSSNLNKNLQYVDTKFHFKKDKELGTRRPTVELKIPVPSLEGIIAILEAGKEKEIQLLLDAVQSVVLEQARAQVNEKEDISQETLDIAALSWEAIANLPPAARRGAGIPKELWEEFSKDYVTVMPAVTGKTVEQVSRAAKLFVAKLQPCKTDKKVLSFLKSQIDLWFANTPNGEDFSDCYEFLSKKVDTFLAADSSALLENL